MPVIPLMSCFDLAVIAAHQIQSRRRLGFLKTSHSIFLMAIDVVHIRVFVSHKLRRHLKLDGATTRYLLSSSVSMSTGDYMRLEHRSIFR